MTNIVERNLLGHMGIEDYASERQGENRRWMDGWTDGSIFARHRTMWNISLISHSASCLRNLALLSISSLLTQSPHQSLFVVSC